MFKLEINKKDVARYLGYKEASLDKETENDIDIAHEKLKKIVVPKTIYRVFNIQKQNNGIYLEGTNMILEGNSISNLLKQCDSCILLAVTLGQGVDLEIRRAEVRAHQLNHSLILDMCASSMVEELCNEINEELKDIWLKKGKYLTDRFSPGYGDLVIDIQKQFCQVLDTTKQIGLHVIDSGLMVPRKSITAIIGVADKQQPIRQAGCENCNLNGTCTYRCKKHED